MEKPSKKELRDSYKEKEVIGGIYCIRCNVSDHTWIKSTKDMAGMKNRFAFNVSTDLCPEPTMSQDWNQYGANSFTLEVLEELAKGETQTDREFTDDLKVLLEMRTEKQK